MKHDRDSDGFSSPDEKRPRLDTESGDNEDVEAQRLAEALPDIGGYEDDVSETQQQSQHGSPVHTGGRGESDLKDVRSRDSSFSFNIMGGDDGGPGSQSEGGAPAPAQSKHRAAIQQQLFLLIHAHKCPIEPPGCGEYCTLMKDVLKHMAECQAGKQCDIPHCASSRQIISHYRKCENQTCAICSPIRKSESVAKPGGGEGASEGLGHMMAGTPNGTAREGTVSPQPHAENGEEPHQNGPGDGNWRSTLNDSHRQRLVRKLVDALHECLTEPKSPSQLRQIANKIEQQVYGDASSEDEYYHLLAEKIYKLKKANTKDHKPAGEGSGAETGEGSGEEGRINSPQVGALEATEGRGGMKETIRQLKAVLQKHQAGQTLTAQEKRLLADCSQVLQAKKMAQLQANSGPASPPTKRPRLDNQSETDTISIKGEPTIPQISLSRDGEEEDESVKKERMAPPSPAPPVSPSDSQRGPKEVKPRYTPEQVTGDLLELHTKMMAQDDAWPFNEPVDPVALGIPDYPKVIKEPMDFQTIKSKLEAGGYSDHLSYCYDVRLVFKNAWLFNKKTHKVYRLCTNMAQYFDDAIMSIMKERGYCCNGERRNYVPPNIYCGGAICSGWGTIPREANYWVYVTEDQKVYNACEKCVASSTGDQVSLLDEMGKQFFVAATSLQQRCNNLVEEEPLGECAGCKMKVHPICRVFNKNADRRLYCRLCEEEREGRIKRRAYKRYSAEKLERTELSDYLEERLNKLIEGSGALPVIVRLVNNCDKRFEIGPYTTERFPDHPKYLPYRHKSIFMFQKQEDGTEVAFFGLHLQEYGSDCPAPNKHRLYISYLDSVHFFQPKSLRTAIYHDCLVGYFDYCRKLGYTWAHIWACPPTAGDDYIFYCHPEDQRVPKPRRLQEWYRKMLQLAKDSGAVHDFRDMMQQKELDNMESSRDLPKFYGDYWPDVLEQHIAKLKEDEGRDDEQDSPAGKGGAKRGSKKGNRKRVGKTSKRGGQLERQNSELAGILFEQMGRNKEVFFVVQLQEDVEESMSKTIVDPNPVMERELLDGREGFLNVARENHYQFNTLRCAKYSTGMFLWHLHNTGPDMTTVQGVENICNMCDTRLGPADVRWHCNVCEDFDLCDGCYKTSQHEHSDMTKQGLFDFEENEPKTPAPADNQVQGEGAIREEKRPAKNLMTRLQEAFVHCATCTDDTCSGDLCVRMKKMLRHWKTCPRRREKQDCKHCRLLMILSSAHASVCDVGPGRPCPVLLCNHLRTQIAARRRQQMHLLKVARKQQAAKRRRAMQLLHQPMPQQPQPPPTPGAAHNTKVMAGAPPSPNPQGGPLSNPPSVGPGGKLAGAKAGGKALLSPHLGPQPPRPPQRSPQHAGKDTPPAGLAPSPPALGRAPSQISLAVPNPSPLLAAPQTHSPGPVAPAAKIQAQRQQQPLLPPQPPPMAGQGPAGGGEGGALVNPLMDAVRTLANRKLALERKLQECLHRLSAPDFGQHERDADIEAQVQHLRAELGKVEQDKTQLVLAANQQRRRDSAPHTPIAPPSPQQQQWPQQQRPGGNMAQRTLSNAHGMDPGTPGSTGGGGGGSSIQPILAALVSRAMDAGQLSMEEFRAMDHQTRQATIQTLVRTNVPLVNQMLMQHSQGQSNDQMQMHVAPGTPQLSQLQRLLNPQAPQQPQRPQPSPQLQAPQQGPRPAGPGGPVYQVLSQLAPEQLTAIRELHARISPLTPAEQQTILDTLSPTQSRLLQAYHSYVTQQQQQQQMAPMQPPRPQMPRMPNPMPQQQQQQGQGGQAGTLARLQALLQSGQLPPQVAAMANNPGQLQLLSQQLAQRRRQQQLMQQAQGQGQPMQQAMQGPNQGGPRPNVDQVVQTLVQRAQQGMPLTPQQQQLLRQVQQQRQQQQQQQQGANNNMLQQLLQQLGGQGTQ